MGLHEFYHHSDILSCITFHKIGIFFAGFFHLKCAERHFKFFSKYLQRNSRFGEGWTVLTETTVLGWPPFTAYIFGLQLPRNNPIKRGKFGMATREP